MTSVTKYANTINQTSGSYATGKSYRTWTDINNLKSSGSVSVCNNLGGKNGTWPRPSTITLTNFGFSIPSTATIKSITVGYTHWQTVVGGAYGTFTAPTISLVNVSNASAKGSGVSKTQKNYTKTFSVSPSVSAVNNSKFGVKINYPANSSTNPAKINLKNVFIKVTYVDNGFTVSASSSNAKPVKNEELNIKVTLKSNSAISSTPSVTFALPSGVTLVERVSGNGTITNNSGTVTWKTSFSNVKSVSVTFKIKCTSTGSKSFTFKETSTNAKFKLSINCIEPQVDLNVINPSSLTQGSSGVIAINILSKNQTDNQSSIISENVTVTFATGDYSVSVNDKGSGTIVSRNPYVYTPNISEGSDYIVFDVSVNVAMRQPITYTVKYGSGEAVNYTIPIKPSELSIPYFVKIVLDDDELERMGNSKNYNVSSMMKLVMNASDVSLYNAYDKNYRIGVFNTYLPDNANDEYLFENAIFEDDSYIHEPNVAEEVCVNFDYSEDYPVIILITGEYLEASALASKLQFTYPCVMENITEDQLVEEPGLFFKPVKSIVETDFASECIVPVNENTNGIRCYDMLLSGLVDEDNTRVVQGVKVSCTVDSDNPISMIMKLVNNVGDEGSRSINIDEPLESQEITIGDEFDLWGLNYEDFQFGNIEDLELEIIASNPFSDSCDIVINDIMITFYFIEVPDSIIQVWVNDIDLRYYNVFVQNIDVPAGTNNEVKYLDVEGTDSNLAYRSNIQSKEITMDVYIAGCNVQETSLFVERLARLLSNKRDKFNKPILNRIRFSHYPDEEWEYLIEDTLDLQTEFADYEGSIKLVVPSGTSKKLLPTVSNATGTNNGIAKVNPTILLVANGTDITVTEERTNQTWTINDPSLQVGDVLRLECAERKVYKEVPITSGEEDEDTLTKGMDITDKVDFNSDWFLIHDDYEFNCHNTAIIRNVSFYERW